MSGATLKDPVKLMIMGLRGERKASLLDEMEARKGRTGISRFTFSNWMTGRTPFYLSSRNIDVIKKHLNLPADYVITELLETKEAQS